MRWSQLHKIAISLPLAVLAALALIAINESGYQRSHRALQTMAHNQAAHSSVNRLLQSMLDAETGHRGYLLTEDERYLQPYEVAVSTVNSNLDELRTLLADAEAWEMVTFEDAVAKSPITFFDHPLVYA